MNSMIAFLKKANGILRKVFIVLIAYFVIGALYINFSGGGSTSLDSTVATKQLRTQIYATLNNKGLQSSKDGKQFLKIYKAVNCGFIGEGCTDNPSDGDRLFDSSFFGFLTQGITIAYRAPPASGVYWVSNGLQKAGFIPKSYAAEGIGFGALRPISGLWEKMRDLALIVITLILITIGFLIMFRMKINPQTVISVENALPRIFIALLLVVFSFAIAGFLIDLMYVITGLVIAILDKNALKDVLTGSTSRLFDEIFWNANILELGPDIFSILPGILKEALRLIILVVGAFGAYQIPPFKALFEGKPAQDIPFFGGVGQTAIAFAIYTVFIGAAALFVPYILSIVILITGGLVVFFRIVILLIMAYVRIVLMVVFAPIILLLEAIPGRKMFMFWLKNIAADLAAFTITACLIVVSGHIVNTTSRGFGPLWQPPFLYSASGNAFPNVIGLAILFAIPSIIKKFREMLGIKPSGIFGPTLFFTGTGAGAGGAGSITQKFVDFRYKSAYLPTPLLNVLRNLPGFKSLGESFHGGAAGQTRRAPKTGAQTDPTEGMGFPS